MELQKPTDLNRVELRGRVGQDPKIFNVGNTQVARFSLATSEIFHDMKGELKEETTWHNIAAWAGKNVEDLGKIRKGAFISLVGRIRNNKYTSTEGENRQFSEIVVVRLNVLDN